MFKSHHFYLLFLSCITAALLSSCGDISSSSSSGKPNMGGPTEAARKAQIATEPTGNFFYGRRYNVEHTRFWGYLRKPRQSAQQSKLVIMNERKKRTPDRFSENGRGEQRYGFDQNSEYRIYGRYTGEKAYEINSNQFLPEFELTGYQLVSRKPGWLFSPNDSYNYKKHTLKPRRY